MCAEEEVKASHYAAPNLTEYKQFIEILVPEGSGASSAWIGEIQPFGSDESANAFLHDTLKDAPVWIHAGKIRDAITVNRHWASNYLVNMVRTCKVLVLVMPKPMHPRAYLLSPRFQEYYGLTHPHPRWDQRIQWEGRTVPGLCIYSPPEFQYDKSIDLMAQFLDQLAIDNVRYFSHI